MILAGGILSAMKLIVSQLPRGIYAVVVEKNGQLLPAGKVVLESN